MAAGTVPTPDRRVARTQKLLREALHSLIHEKSYDAIVVKEILDRANVGRSAFYTHFKDKDALLVSSIHDLVGVVPAARERSGRLGREAALWFSLPILQYHEQHRGTSKLRHDKKAQAVLHEHLREVLTTLVAQRLRSPGQAKGQIPAALQAEFIAGTFVLVLDWWVGSRMSLRAVEANEIFRSLVLPCFGEG